MVAISRGQCEVEWQGEIAICHLPKALALVQKSDLAVGDRLRVARRPSGELVVAQVLPRSSRLSRPDPLLVHRERVLAANIDLAVVVTALRKPALATGLLDRFLVALAHGGVAAAIAVNKYDLAETSDAAGDPELARLTPYRALSLPFLFCSARSGRGIEELRALIAGKTVVFVGHSGVGKSSLLAALSPELDVRVGEVSTMNARGRHTTTRARIYRLPGETRIIDTPGIRKTRPLGAFPRGVSCSRSSRRSRRAADSTTAATRTSRTAQSRGRPLQARSTPTATRPTCGFSPRSPKGADPRRRSETPAASGTAAVSPARRRSPISPGAAGRQRPAPTASHRPGRADRSAPRALLPAARPAAGQTARARPASTR